MAELKRIEGQQQQLKTAAVENKVLIVHPIEGVDLDEDEDEYAEVKEVKADPDLFVPSGQSFAQSTLQSQHKPVPSSTQYLTALSGVQSCSILLCQLDVHCAKHI